MYGKKKSKGRRSVKQVVVADRGFLNYVQPSAGYARASTVGERLYFFDTAHGPANIAELGNATGGMQDPDQGGILPATDQKCLNAIPLGNSQSSRLGQEVVYRKVYVTGIVRRNAAAGLQTGTQQKVYIALVLDKQTNGAQATSDQVFINPSLSDGLAANPLKNMEYTKRFRVLDTWEGVFDVITAAPQGGNTSLGWTYGQTLKFVLNWRGRMRGNFQGDEGAISQISDNSFHVVAFAQTGAGAAVEILYNSRIRFEA